MKRMSLSALLLALLLLATACGRAETPPDEPTAPDTVALTALLEAVTPEGATIANVRSGDGTAYPAGGAIRAEDYLATLRGFDWTAYLLPSDWDGSNTGSYRLTADGAELTLYSIDDAAVLHAVLADGEGWFTVPNGETQTNRQLSETVRAWYDGAEAAARYAYGGTPLTGEELAYFEQFTLSSRTEGNVTYATPIACFFTSTYEDVRDLDAVEFLRYCPSEGSVANADGEEARLVAEKLDRRDESGRLLTVDELPTPCHRISRAYLDGILTEYAGVTVVEMHSDWTAELFYLPETDCFYAFTSDFGPGVFRPAYGERSGKTVRLWESGENGDCLTLDRAGEGWRIRSHEAGGAASEGVY